MQDFIQKLRSKPEHIRHRIAFGTAGGVTAVVALMWLGSLAASGNLALAVPSPGDTNAKITATSGTGGPAVPDVPGAIAQASASISQLMSAAGVAMATTAPASLTIVDAAPTSTPDVAQRNSMGQTVIPF